MSFRIGSKPPGTANESEEGLALRVSVPHLPPFVRSAPGRSSMIEESHGESTCP